jgi:signal transduction histidine kinase
MTDRVLSEYAQALRDTDSPLISGREIWRESERQAREILGEFFGSLDGSDPPGAAAGPPPSSPAPAAPPADHRAGAGESVRAYRLLTECVLDLLPELLDHLPADQALSRHATAVRTLFRSVADRVDAALAGGGPPLAQETGRAGASQRRRLAGDIHDRIGSSLSLALRCLEMYELEEGRPSSQTQRLKDAAAAIQDAFTFSREVVSGLRSPECGSDIGAQLAKYAATMSSSVSEVRVQVNGNTGQLPAGQREDLFLAVRECLRNAVAHANATRISAVLDISPNTVEVTVEDNGVGIDPVILRNAEKLQALKDRVSRVRGKIFLPGKPGGGTIVHIHAPIAASELGGIPE